MNGLQTTLVAFTRVNTIVHLSRYSPAKQIKDTSLQLLAHAVCSESLWNGSSRISEESSNAPEKGNCLNNFGQHCSLTD